MRVFGLLALLGATRAAAACDFDSPSVGVSFTGQLSVAFERAMLADLEAGLGRSHVRVCPLEPAAAQPPVAHVAELRVDARSSRLVELRIRMRNGEGTSLLDRQMDLSQVPADSRAFAVALAADELLRAGGVEWLDGSEPAGIARMDPAHARTAASIADLAEADGVSSSSKKSSWSVGARMALERFGGGLTLWGADAAVLLPLTASLQLQLAPGLRRGVGVSAPQGHVESGAFSLAANVRYLLVDGSWQLALGLGLQGAHLKLQGTSRNVVTTTSRFVDVALYGQGLLSASVRISGPLRLELSGALGAPLRALEATDDGRVATAASGLQLAVSAGLWLQL